MRKLIFTIALIITVVSVITLIVTNNNNKTFLEKEGLDGLTTVEMVNKLEAKTLDPNNYNASITATELNIFTSIKTYTFDVPDDLFYLSFAPYINQTHPCGTHSLVTCRGELKNTTFYVLIKDDLNEIIFDQAVTTGSNGFAGIWLPRNMTGTIYVEYNQFSATTQIETYESSNTCLTTLKLTS